MPTKVTAYSCSFGCKRNLLITKRSMLKHESLCFKNPARKACITCGNFGFEDFEDDTGVGGNFCEAEIDIRTKLKYDCVSWKPKNL
jgi:hypothetical protein